ncbi:MAG: hypothetical protein WKF43_11160 [Acidimicrobiales bacterium]
MATRCASAVAGCFHYSGLVEHAPWSLSQFMGDVPRVNLRDHPAVARLCRRYLHRLRSAGLEADRGIPYLMATAAGGTPLDRRARRLWRDQLMAAEGDPVEAGPRAPSPFADDGGLAWLAWLRSPSDGDSVGRYLRRVWSESAHLQQTFPHLDDAETRARYHDWVLTWGVEGAEIPQALLPDREDVAMEGTSDRDDRRRRHPPSPDVRTQQPLPQLDAARHTLDGAPTGVANRGLRRIADRVLAGRDERSDEVARQLVEAVAELTERIAELGDRVNRVHDELPEHADGIDWLGDETTRLADASLRLSGRLDHLDEALAAEGRRVEGALEQDSVTAGIVADAESRLTAEIRSIEQRVDKLATEVATEHGGNADNDDDNEEGEVTPVSK